MKSLTIAVCGLLLCSRLSAADLSAGDAYQQGLVLFIHGDYTQARTTFEKLEPTLQRRAEFNFHYAITLLQTTRSADALKFMQRAIDLAPGNAEYRYALALIYAARVSELSLFRAAMLMDDAKQTLLKALELDPAHVGATLALAEFYLDVPGIMGGGKDRALPLLDRLWKLDPAAAAELNAKVEKGAGNLRRAEELYLQAVAAPDSRATVRLKLAKFYVDQKIPAKAIRYGEEYLRMPRTWTDFPADTTYAHLWLAIAYRLQGDLMQSRKHAEVVAGSWMPQRMREEVEERCKQAGVSL